MHDLPFFPKSVLSCSISHACSLYAKKEKALPMSNLSGHFIPSFCNSPKTVLLAALPWFYSSAHHISTEDFFTYKSQPHSWAGLDISGGWSRAILSKLAIIFYSTMFYSRDLGLLWQHLHPFTMEEKPQTPLFFCFSERLKSFACFLPWRIINHQEMMHSFDTSLGSHADWYQQEQQASPEHMCKYSRIANTKDKHSWTKQLCWREGNACKWCFAVLPALRSPLYSITWSFTQRSISMPLKLPHRA